MPNTLGLDDDLDGVELVKDLERIFDIKVSNEEAERILTVGEFHDLLLRKIPPNEADRKCARAMTFYRLRSALGRLGYGEKLTPASDMHILERGRIKSNFKSIERECGLRLPRAEATKVVWRAFLCSFLVTLIGVFVLEPGISSMLSGVLLGLLCGLVVVCVVGAYVDPGQLPANCATLADLTKNAAAMNYGRLIKMGARHREDDIWHNLVEALCHYMLPKSEITRETYFLQSQLKKNAAA